MNKKERAELTIETAIVFVVVLSVIGAMISMTLYAHDMVVIRSGCYSALSEGASKNKEDCSKLLQKAISTMPLFVVKPSASLSENVMEYKASVRYKTNIPLFGMGKLFSSSQSEVISVQKQIDYSAMGMYKGIKDGIK